MSLSQIVHRITNALVDLAKELESRGLHRSALMLLTATHLIKWLKRVCIYTKGMILKLEGFGKEIDKASEKIIVEKPENLKKVDEYLADFITNLNYTIHSIVYGYAKTRLLLAILIMFYSATIIINLSALIEPELVLRTTYAIIWLNVSLYILMLLDLMAMFILILAIPIAPLIVFMYSGLSNTIFGLSSVLAHTVCLSVAISFTLTNIRYYKLLRSTLTTLSNRVENLVNNLRRVLEELYIETKASETSLNKLMLSLYGDKAYELIRYVDDMRNLAR